MRKLVDKVNQSELKRDEQVLDLIHTVMHQYRSQQYQVLRDGPHEITHMESKVLGFFARHPGATQSALAEHSGRDKAQLARLIKALRERGLLAGAEDQSDRRSVSLSLTAAGQAVLRTLRQQGNLLNAKAVAGFTAAEKDKLAAMLARVKVNLDDKA